MSNETLRILVKEKYGRIRKQTEEELVRLAAQETDYMVKLLIQGLKKNNLYNNTVIVAFTDHYLYTLEDKSILDKYKETDNGLVNKTPFFIWSKDIKKESVNKVTMQADILPTVLNLFGNNVENSYFIGTDALNGEKEGIVFYADYSWYDGNVYVKQNNVINGGNIPKKELEEKNKRVFDMIYKNDMTVNYNYFGKKKK